MDREKIRGDFNLSLKKLPDLLIDKNVAEEVRKQIESLDNSDDLKGIRSWRHKKGAHNDYVSIVTEVDLSLKQQAVSECLGKICKIMSAAFVQDDIFGNVTPDRTGLKSHRHMFALLEYGLDKIQQESDEAKTALVAKNSDLAAFMNGYFYSMLPSRDSHEK